MISRFFNVLLKMIITDLIFNMRVLCVPVYRDIFYILYLIFDIKKTALDSRAVLSFFGSYLFETYLLGSKFCTNKNAQIGL
jgi:hypothetical protein